MPLDQPPSFVINLRRDGERWKRCEKHFSEVGVKADRFFGLDYERTGLFTIHKYEVDNPGYTMGPKTVSLHLSHYMLWNVLLRQPGDSFWVLEDDCLWDSDWRPRWEQAIKSLPKDWDLLYLGSCCAKDKPGWKVNDNLHVVQFPQCTHAYQVRKKALPLMLEHCEKVWAPVDICLVLDVLPKLQHFTILPRLCGQHDTLLPP